MPYSDIRSSIIENLQLINDAAQVYFLNEGSRSATYQEIIEAGFLEENIKSHAGESYDDLILHYDYQILSVTTENGNEIFYDFVEEKILFNLRSIAREAVSAIASLDKKSISYKGLIREKFIHKNSNAPIDGEDYTSLKFRPADKEVSVTRSNGKKVILNIEGLFADADEIDTENDEISYDWEELEASLNEIHSGQDQPEETMPLPHEGKDHEIAQFWQTFERIHHGLSKKRVLKKLRAELLDSMRRINFRLKYFLKRHEGSFQLILSAEGDPDLVELVSIIAKSFPSIEGWNVTQSFSGEFEIEKRSSKIFPSDQVGDWVYHIFTTGDQIWIKRKIDFSFLFASEELAKAFAYDARFNFESIKAEIKPFTKVDNYAYEVYLETMDYAIYYIMNRYLSDLEFLSSHRSGTLFGWSSEVVSKKS